MSKESVSVLHLSHVSQLTTAESTRCERREGDEHSAPPTEQVSEAGKAEFAVDVWVECGFDTAVDPVDTRLIEVAAARAD